MLLHATAFAISENFKEIIILVLSSGNIEIEYELCHSLASSKGNNYVFIGYNEELAHQIYATSDFLLMTSKVEPNDFDQMYSMRNGTIPIMRRTGGLNIQ